MTRKPVGRNDIPQLFRTTALNRVEPLLNRLNPEGYFGPGGPKALSHERQFIYPLAYFYKTPFPGNPYGGERRILDAAVSIGTHVARCTLKSGEMEYESRGYHGRVVDQRFLYFWIKAYALLKRDLPLSIGKRWESAMNRSLRHLNRRLTGYLEQERFNWKSFGTGPNHAILYATALYQGGLHFKNKAWKANALEFAERFAKFQDPEGYYPEGGGPVCVYSLLSHTGVARFALWTGKKPFVDACHRAFAYEQKICYPDFSYVGLIDKRQHYSPIPAIWGLFGYSFTPEGRAFAARKMAARLKRRPDLGGEDSALCLENFESWQHGPCARIRSWRGETFLGNRICFVREKGWQYDFCVNAAIVNPRSAFRLADEKVYSVWHRSLGALVLGTQDKHQPRHNTFWAKSGEELGVFLGGRIGNKARPRYVEAVYSNGLTGR
ncbi:MAG: hypothetical protein JXR37_29765, partial [Kiritimatiellae bacterium]|nr:hypothetical protein [Kiritimatiellia bacterium]